LIDGVHVSAASRAPRALQGNSESAASFVNDSVSGHVHHSESCSPSCPASSTQIPPCWQ
jgi:hypothetical protein